MEDIQKLIDQNRAWSERIRQEDPDFFRKLQAQQRPKYLWIGCSDSRVPANEIIGLMPGEVFVHRNVANLVVHTDFNCLSVIQFAVEFLEIEHIIVCGHYGCGGVIAALESTQLGLIDNWLRHIKDVHAKHEKQLEPLEGEAKSNALCELNVIEQVYNVCSTSVVQQAWRSGRELQVHGWIYSLADGLVNDLGCTVDNVDDVEPIYRTVSRT